MCLNQDKHLSLFSVLTRTNDLQGQFNEPINRHTNSHWVNKHWNRHANSSQGQPLSQQTLKQTAHRVSHWVSKHRNRQAQTAHWVSHWVNKHWNRKTDTDSSQGQPPSQQTLKQSDSSQGPSQSQHTQKQTAHSQSLSQQTMKRTHRRKQSPRKILTRHCNTTAWTIGESKHSDSQTARQADLITVNYTPCIPRKMWRRSGSQRHGRHTLCMGRRAGVNCWSLQPVAPYPRLDKKRVTLVFKLPTVIITTTTTTVIIDYLLCHIV